MVADLSKPVPVTDPALTAAPRLRKTRAVRTPVKGFIIQSITFRKLAMVDLAGSSQGRSRIFEDFFSKMIEFSILCSLWSGHSVRLQRVSLVQTK